MASSSAAMSAAVRGKRPASSSSFSEDPSSSSSSSSSSFFPPPSKRARLRADPDLVAAIRERFPSVSIESVEKVLEECGNNFDSAMECLRNLHLQSTQFNVDPVYQSPNGMSMPDEGSAPGTNNLRSGIIQCVELLVNELFSGSNMDDAKARAYRVLEDVHQESVQSLQKENSMYKQQFEAVINENTHLKQQFEAVNSENSTLKQAARNLGRKQNELQKEFDGRNQDLEQLKQLVLQCQEQVRTLEVNNYALSMHLRQAQQGSSFPGHFNRDIF